MIEEFGTADAIDLRVVITKRAIGGGRTGLTPTIKIVNAAGADVTPTSPDDQLTELNASALPGSYQFSDAAGTYPGGTDYEYQVDPNNAAANPPPRARFKIIAASSALPPAGFNLCARADVVDIVAGAATAKPGSVTGGQETFIDKIIGRVTAFIEGGEGADRIFVQRAVDETGNGNGSREFFLKSPPVGTTLTQVFIDDDADGTLEEITDLSASEFTVDPDLGILVRRKKRFPVGIQNVRILYTGGYAVIPADIGETACEMAAHRFDLYARRLLGITSETIGDGNRSYTSADFLPRHKDVLAAYRLGGVV